MIGIDDEKFSPYPTPNPPTKKKKRKENFAPQK